MDAQNKYTLVLGSQSPRRKELLSWMKIPFEIIVSSADETSHIKDPKKMVEEIAERKARAVYEMCAKKESFSKSFFPLIASADTIVTLKEKVYGKPSDINDARRMLLELSNKEHVVYTGVSIFALDLKTKKLREHTFCADTIVHFDNITEDILENYLASGESLDKAGSYGIQGQTLTFISYLKGSYSNVVGFPLSHFIDELKNFLGHENDKKGEWRKYFHGGK